MFYPNDTDSSKLVSDYGYSENYIIKSDNSATFDGNKFNGGMQKVAGSDGTDEKNVVIVYDNPSNENKTIFDNSTFNIIGEIVESILENTTAEPEDLIATARKNKREYVKMASDNVMLDYSTDAKYKNDKTVTLKCNITNANNEDSILDSIQFVNEEINEKKTLVPKDIQKETVTYSNGSSGITGYKIPANSDLNFSVEFSLKDWQKGYNTMLFKTKARLNYVKAKKTFYLTQSSFVESNISIFGRELFNLE